MLVAEARCQLYDESFQPAYHLPVDTLVEVEDEEGSGYRPGSFIRVRTPGMQRFWWGRWAYFKPLPPPTVWQRLLGPHLV